MTTKKHKAVMLPTDKESELYIGGGSGDLGFTKDYSPQNNGLNRPQHLYILSDDEIRDGDWYHNSNGIFKCSNNNAGTHELNFNYSEPHNLSKWNKKILASTDKSLNLPWIDLSKSQWILSYYNEKKKLPEIELKEHVICSKSECNGECLKCEFMELKLKLNPDGSVNIIEPVKNDFKVLLAEELHPNIHWATKEPKEKIDPVKHLANEINSPVLIGKHEGYSTNGESSNVFIGYPNKDCDCKQPCNGNTCIGRKTDNISEKANYIHIGNDSFCSYCGQEKPIVTTNNEKNKPNKWMHLEWIYYRMVREYEENPNVDYMFKFYNIIQDFKKKDI